MSDMVQILQLLGPSNPRVSSGRDSQTGGSYIEDALFGWWARIPTRPLLWIVIAGLALIFLLPGSGELREGLANVGSVGWGWLIAGLLVSALGYPMAAWAQMGAVDRRLGFRRTVLVQVAATFVGQVTPQGIGGMGLNARYLEREGMGRAAAVGAVTLDMAAGAVVHVLILLLVVALVGASWLTRPEIQLSALLIAPLLAALGLATALLAWPTGRRRVVIPVAAAIHDVLLVLRRPLRAVQLFGGSAGVTGVYALTLAVSAAAFGSEVSVLGVVTVYLVGIALGSLVPTPGGLGGVEAALVSGLVALDMELAPAIATVSTYRLLTYWGPILPGLLAFRYLRRTKAI